MQVAELMVRGVVVGLFRENCWIIGSRRTGAAVVVDPGDEADEILALARDLGVRIEKIVCTHAHLDHVLATGPVKEATGAPLLLQASDLDLLRAVPQQAAWFGLSAPRPPDPDFLLQDGDDLEVAGITLRVIHTPGHTPGAVSLYTPGLLFSGDTLFRGSIGRTDLPGGDYRQLLASLVDRLLALPDDTVVLPGHLEQTTIGQERATNPFVREELARRAAGAGPRR